MTISEQFAEWVCGLDYESIPPAVVQTAKEAISDAVSLMVLGSGVGRVAPFRRLVGARDDSGGATIVGDRMSFRPRDAAFVNAVYAHSSEFDDIFVAAGGHPGAVTVPAAFATAEHDGLTGRDLIVAVTAGYEIMHRSINPIFPGTQRRGFQGTGLAGPFGAAAAVGSLRRLDASTLADALGIAGSYCSGLMEYDQSGGESKRLYAGLGARAGVEAAALAEAGVNGPRTIYEGKRGVYAAFSDERDVDRATAGLGEEFRILSHRHVKPYPVVASIHGTLDALGVLMPTAADADEVASVIVQLPPLALSHGGAIGIPTDTLSAQFSFAFAIAVKLLTGTSDLEWFEDDAFRRSPAVAQLCAKVTLEADPDLAANAQQGGAIVTIEFSDGRTVRRAEPVPTGRPDNPLTFRQRKERFARFASGGLGEAAAERLRSLLEEAETLESMAPIASILASSGREAAQ